LVTSVIRRELPAMDTEEFEDLDYLAKGFFEKIFENFLKKFF